MTSAYLHARDMIEQARAILANEAWFDPDVDRLLDRTMNRLAQLEARAHGGALAPMRPVSTSQLRRGMMPWLDTDPH